MKLTATEIDGAIDERTLREQHPEFDRLIRHLEAVPRSTAPRFPRRPLPRVVRTRRSWWQRLLDWIAGDSK
jgi:hypothetical protein